MDEFKFVIKCFIFATAIVLFSQTKINGETLENKAEIFLQDSPAAEFIRRSAEGGAQILSQTFEKSKSYIKRKMAQAGESAEPIESESSF